MYKVFVKDALLTLTHTLTETNSQDYYLLNNEAIQEAIDALATKRRKNAFIYHPNHEEILKKFTKKIPLEVANDENWNEEIVRLGEVVAEHEADPTEASQYAVWTIFNGLRVNHEAFLTGNIWDTMLALIIDGHKVIDPASRHRTLILKALTVSSGMSV